MSKNRELGNLGNLTGTAGQNVVAQSDGSYTLDTPSLSLDNYTISADADPATDTNPSAAGALWLNQNTNQLYICVDATADANVWKGLTFDEDPPVPAFQGSSYGYASGGNGPSNVIDKFSLTSDANATDVGDLTVARQNTTGQTSSGYGYTSGGDNPSLPVSAVNTIDKFPFSSDADATDVGDITVARLRLVGQSAVASGYGYCSGGFPATNIIEKFPFSTDSNATDVGDLTLSRHGPAGQSSTDYGYTSGGHASPYTNRIDKFPFASDANATDVGDLTLGRYHVSGQSSTDYGYSSGGWAPPQVNRIDKFPFSSDADATDVGDLTATRYATAGQSSNDNGYVSGGAYPGVNNIEKFSFSTDGNATDVGDLTVARYSLAGQQY